MEIPAKRASEPPSAVRFIDSSMLLNSHLLNNPTILNPTILDRAEHIKQRHCDG